MSHSPIVPSLESIADSIGSRVSGHMNLTFRRMMPTADITDYSIRQITGEAHPFGNTAMIAEPTDWEISAAAIAPLLAGDYPSAVIYTQGVAEEVSAKLIDSGFVDGGAMPAMAVDIAKLAPATLPDGYTWTRVTPEDYQAWTETLAVGYGLPFGVARLFSPLSVEHDSAADADAQFFAVKCDGKIVATSLLHLADGLAGIYCISVLSAERGKGLGGFATGETLREAQNLGYQVGVLQSSADGHSVYQRLGFQDVGSVPLFVRAPDAPAK